MSEKETVINIAHHARFLLWGFVAFVFICALGLPTLFNIDIDPLKDSTWLFVGFVLLETIAVPNVVVEPGEIVLSSGQIALFTLLFIALSVTLTKLVWNMDRLFRQYALGHIFTECSIKHFLLIGWSLIALFALNTISDNLIAYLFMQQEIILESIEAAAVESADNVEEFFSFFISLDFSLLLAGVFVVVVGRVMQIGKVLQNDVDATI